MCCAQAARTRGLRADGFSRDDLRESQSTKNQLNEVNCQSGSRDFNFLKRQQLWIIPLSQTSPNCSDFLESLASILARNLTRGTCVVCK